MKSKKKMKKILLIQNIKNIIKIIINLNLILKKEKFIITFPKPRITPECFYAILYLSSNGYKYYTLELDIGSSIIFKDGGGIICGQSGSSHLNYGRRCKDDKKEFEKAVQDIIDGKPFDIFQDYKNIDYKEASKQFGMTEEEFKEKCTIF